MVCKSFATLASLTLGLTLASPAVGSSALSPPWWSGSINGGEAGKIIGWEDETVPGSKSVTMGSDEGATMTVVGGGDPSVSFTGWARSTGELGQGRSLLADFHYWITSKSSIRPRRLFRYG